MTASWTNFWLRGRSSAVFDKTCWHDLLLAEAARDAKAGRELFCAALSDCKNDLVLARIEAENKGKTDAARAKGVAGANDKFAEPLERLENAAALLGEVERLAAAGEWTPLYDRLTPYVPRHGAAAGAEGHEKTADRRPQGHRQDPRRRGSGLVRADLGT